jgi:cellulose synthase/poly-beta-1,6-N-acetylglucosamine synthase-like glycosyltransferase
MSVAERVIETRQSNAFVTVNPSVSVVVPTCNEVESIAALLCRLDAAFQELAVPYEVVLVDDHSTDHTVEVARATALHHHLPVRIFSKQAQRGKAYSLIEGFAQARNDILGMIDADLQYPPEAFADMYRALTSADIVVADRRGRYTELMPVRGRLSTVFSSVVVRRLFGIEADVQSGMKLFHRSVYFRFGLHPTPWSFDLDFMAQAKRRGYRIASTPIEFAPRSQGDSKVRAVRVAPQLLFAALGLYLWLLLRPIVAPLMRWGVVPKSERFIAKPVQNPDIEADIQQVLRFRHWLHEHEVRSTDEAFQRVADEFIEQASRPLLLKGEETLAFTAVDPALSAQRTLLPWQLVALVLIASAWTLGFVLFTTATLVFTISLIILLYFKNMVDTARFALKRLDAEERIAVTDTIIDELKDVVWPRYTILCPLYHETAIVAQFASAMQALEYPAERLQVLFLTEPDDESTRAAIDALNLPSHFETLIVPPGNLRTKPRACNYGLMYATGAYVVVYDAEDIPDPRQLKQAVLTFARSDHRLACVQAKLNFYNTRQNPLTRLFTLEYSLWFELLMPGMQQARMSLPLGGTSNHFRAAVLRAVGGWDAFNVTEDCDLGLRLSELKLTTVVIDSVTMEEANSNLRNWMRQRSRWIKGYLQTYLVHMRRPWRYLHRDMLRPFYSLQFIIGGTPATFFVNPLMWAMLGVYIAVRPLVAATYHILYPGPMFYLGVICFVFGNYLWICLSMLACLKRKDYTLLVWAFLLPPYWFAMSVAAVVAIVQLMYKPHHWEKTKHGLHLAWRGPDAEVLSFATSGIHDLAPEARSQ